MSMEVEVAEPQVLRGIEVRVFRHASYSAGTHPDGRCSGRVHAGFIRLREGAGLHTLFTTPTRFTLLVAVDDFACWTDRNLIGRDLRSVFWGSRTMDAMDCFTRCSSVTGCTFSAFKEGDPATLRMPLGEAGAT